MMNKKVLVTGGAGFVAHHVIETILDTTDWDVITIDRLDFSGNLNRLHEMLSLKPKEVSKRVKFIFHDLKAEINLQTAHLIGDVHYILHLAAGSHVDRSIANPLEFVMDNMVGTCNILNFARLYCNNLIRFVYFSTDEVFGPAPHGVKYKERDRYNSTNIYSASKAGGEELSVAFHNTYSLPVYVCHCHDELTRCMTEDGPKNINELKLGDKIWVLDKNSNIILEPILEIVNSPYSGEMIKFYSKNYDLFVTPNHRMVTKIHKKEHDWTIRTAEEMSIINNRQDIPVAGKWNGIVKDNNVHHKISVKASKVEQRNISKHQYTGNIWCVRTNSGNFFIERNGNISCSGNTMNIIGPRQHPEKYIPMTIRNIRDGSTVNVHANVETGEIGSRCYIHAYDVADALMFILNINKLNLEPDFGGAKCPKFNIVGEEEIDNLELAKIIAQHMGKPLNYKLVDFNKSRPGHDLRYSLSGEYMKSLGWTPKHSFRTRIKEIVDWSLINNHWLVS